MMQQRLKQKGLPLKNQLDESFDHFSIMSKSNDVIGRATKLLRNWLFDEKRAFGRKKWIIKMKITIRNFWQETKFKYE